MLNISNNSISHLVDLSKVKSFKETLQLNTSITFAYWIMGFMLLLFILMFLPWTQNIQSKGKVTTLKPEQRPQSIHATIPGRVEKWYVQEGQFIEAGDTIAFLSEIKDDYFDPNLVPRKLAQVKAKEASVQSYQQKAMALASQIAALEKARDLKTEQARNKLRQAELQVMSDSLAMMAAFTDFEIAERQYTRNEDLYKKGLIALTDFEKLTMKFRSAMAKKIEAENKWLAAKNKYINASIELNNIENDYADKIAKAQSDRFATFSSQFDAEASVNKMQTEYQNYAQRADFYYILAPQDGYIIKIDVNGIGETVKQGEKILSILPANYDLAVELYIRPMDLPLIRKGQEVRFIFDGWPAIVFSGWEGMSYGTFAGKVVAIDNIANEKGMYRILVGEDKTVKPWPDALRPGSGAKGIAMLDDVPIWYELWRQLNGFPPDFYENDTEKVKTKAPIKSIKK